MKTERIFPVKEKNVCLLQEATRYEEANAPQSPSPEDIDQYSEDGDIWQYPIPGEGCDYSPPYEHDYPRLVETIFIELDTVNILNFLNGFSVCNPKSIQNAT